MSQDLADADSFGRFYAATAAPIRAYILRHCGDRGAVDDIFQVTYLKFLRSRMGSKPGDPKARPYLYRIASNAITDHGRSLQRRRRFEAPMPEHASRPGPMPSVEGMALRRALRTLSKREQQLLWLLYAEGFAHKEVAAIMRISHASVRVLAFRARKKLARRMAGPGPTAAGGRK